MAQADRELAVLTGDVVGSTRLGAAPRRQLLRALREAARALEGHFAGQLLPPVALFRGDSWQAVLTDAPRGLRAALFFRAWLRARMKTRAVDTRVAVGLGTVDLLPEEAPTTGDGQAFRRSGLALDRMPRGRRLRVEGYPPAALPAPAVDAIVHLIDALARDWTDRQAHAVGGALLGMTQERIAAAWFRKGISQQAVAQHLDRAGWNAIEAALEVFEHGAAPAGADGGAG